MSRSMPADARIQRPDGETDVEPDFDWSWTEDGPAWVAPMADTSRPSVARIYNYALGGKDHYAVDREIAERIAEVVPDVTAVAQANRAFVLRSVSLMAEAGISQFLDLGCGLPTSPAVHEVARAVIPDARIAYVDHDPIVLAHARAALDGQPGLHAVLHDLREPSRVLRDPGVREIIRLDEPLGLLMGCVLHFVDQAIGVQVVDHYLRKLAPGSHVAFSVATSDGVPGLTTARLGRILRAAAAPIVFRTAAQVEELMDGLELLSPGLADVAAWRADGHPGLLRLHAGVGVKR